jgi:hypothetical protein
MIHAMEPLPCKVKSHVHCAQSNCPHARKDQKSHARTLGVGPPFVFALQILKGIDGEDQFRDREDEHYAEEYAMKNKSVAA